MGLTTGTRLGPYEIISSIVAGGMGEVYRARDTRLQRDVRLARFQREAQVLASLNHPHIAAIYGFEDTVRPTRSSSNSSKARHSPIGLRASRG